MMSRRHLVVVLLLGALIGAWFLFGASGETDAGVDHDDAETGSAASTRAGGGRFLSDRVRAPSRPLRLAPTRAIPSPEEPHGAFAGRVISWADSSPVHEAELTFESNGSTFSTQTRIDGSFFMRPPAVGTYMLVAVEAAGFHPFAPAWGHSPRSFTAVAETTVEGIVIHLVPKVRYRIEVVDSEGTAVEGAAVSVLSLDDAGLVPPESGTVTDVRGQAEVEAADDAIIEARHEEHGVARASVDLRAQIQRSIRLELDPEQAERFASDGFIEGRVVDASGSPVADALVAGTRWGGLHPQATSLTDDEGLFRLEGLDPGRYFIRAAARGYSPGFQRRVEVGSTTEVQLGEEGRLRGAVRGPDGPVAGFAVAVERRLGQLQSRHAASVAEYDPNGNFEVDGLATGTYRVTASATGFAPAEAEVSVSAGSTANVGELTLGASGAVHGVVTSDGEPVSGARVSLEGRLGNASLPTSQSTLTGPDGVFSLDGLGPGRTSVVVAAEGHHARIQSGIDIVAGNTVELAITLRPLDEGEDPSLELAGIGAILGARGDAIYINQVMEGGGAAAVGLTRGDAIISVDGAPVTDLGFRGAIEQIRGAEGTIVQLVIRRGGEELPFAVTRMVVQADTR